ncbi:hypothetical protein [Streptomyces sp. CC228A]|uniref:hypothetical protein n=1 Tax=Streptomyces sp. CC228A TaxID=2898186 RepID=UPI001F165BBF|nr:hypothetical protein [Streptomyces sp. CC228A]
MLFSVRFLFLHVFFLVLFLVVVLVMRGEFRLKAQYFLTSDSAVGAAGASRCPLAHGGW